MSAKLHKAVVPLFVALCLLAGGSTQNPWSIALLHGLALALLGWSLIAARRESASVGTSLPVLLAAATAVLVLLQIVPLPAGLWSLLPGRDFVADGLAALGMARPAMPLSLAPAVTLATGFALLVPVAVYAAMVRQRAFAAEWLVAAVGLAALAGTILGILQIGGGYALYPVTNRGAAAGFFANANHMGLLLVMTVPLVAGLAVERWRGQRRASRRWTWLALVAGSGAVVAVAMLTNGSLAILGLAPVVVLASALLPSWDGREKWRRLLAGLLALTVVATVAATALLPGHLSVGESASYSTRAEIWSRSAHAAAEYFPAGSGLGTFEQVYPRFEDVDAVDRFYANHAHNDYLELAIELGAPGILLMLMFLGWWGRTAWRLWSRSGQPVMARAAVIASAAALAHSIVDFPLRTPALAALFAACCALMAMRAAAEREKGALRKSRHLTIR